MDAWDVQRAGKLLGKQEGREGVGSIHRGMNWRDLRTCAGELVRSPKKVFREHHRRSKGLHRCYTETDRFHHPRCGLSFIPSNPGPFKTDMPCVVSVNKVSPDFPLSTVSILEVLCLLLFPCVVVDIRDSLFLWFWVVSKIPMDEFSAVDAWPDCSHFFF